MHDHAESERRRQQEEAKATSMALASSRQEILVLEGAVRRIADFTTTSGHRQIAEDALSAVRKLRSTR